MPNPKPAILVAVALGIAAGIAVSVKPWATYAEQREEAKAVRQELEDVRKERKRLEIEEAKSDSDVGRETKARDAGYHAPGEKELKLKDEPSEAPTPPAKNGATNAPANTP